MAKVKVKNNCSKVTGNLTYLMPESRVRVRLKVSGNVIYLLLVGVARIRLIREKL